MRRLFASASGFVLPLLLIGAGICAKADGPKWIDLFNGRDLAGWETILATPIGGTERLGVNNDPKKVFQVVEQDGQPAIRISGEILGGITTIQSFENYHLELEFKWGEARFAPRANDPRDSGLLFHGAGGYNEGSGWIESVEFGILEGGETGDVYSVPGEHGARIVVDLEAVDIPDEKLRYPRGVQSIQHRPGGTLRTGTTEGILNSDDNEKPRGQWNKLDLFCLGQRAIYLVNGTVNMELNNIRRVVDGREEPVTSGRLQLQSEGAEVYYRNLRLRPIEAIPKEHLEALRRPLANTLSADETKQGWRLLFDGQSLEGWRSYGEDSQISGWEAKDGSLRVVGKGADLITADEYDDFELRLDWRISEGGNSGIFYRATGGENAIYKSGPEYELRDNAYWEDNPFKTAANYALHEYDGAAARPVGYWNTTRIVVRGNKVEHWLNDQKVVAYEIDSDDWKARVKNSHVREWPAYGKTKRGHIGLQNYEGYPVWFRNIKLLPLAAE